MTPRKFSAGTKGGRKIGRGLLTKALPKTKTGASLGEISRETMGEMVGKGRVEAADRGKKRMKRAHGIARLDCVM